MHNLFENKKRIRYVAMLVLPFIMMPGLYLAWIQFRFQSTPIIDSMLSDRSYVWAHRGLKEGFEENSLESLANAFDHGASGVELDVFYDQRLDRFVVSHEEPSDTKPGARLYLDTVFSIMGSKGFFGIDFKNPTASNMATAETRLLELFSTHNVGQKVFVEGGDPATLRRFSSSRIKTVLSLQAWGGASRDLLRSTAKIDGGRW